MNVEQLVAIDVHVHIECDEQHAANDAAKKYFGNSSAATDRNSIADYYRSRNIGCVVFPVDERLSGRPVVPNEEVAEFAAQNADIMMAFASLDPTKGPDVVREARRLVNGGYGIRGL